MTAKYLFKESLWVLVSLILITPSFLTVLGTKHIHRRNMFYINAALEQLASEGYPIRPEEVARLSPLVFDHINLLGRYAFAVPESVARGQLRRLRNPTDALEDLP